MFISAGHYNSCYVTYENTLGNWERSIITCDVVIKGATEHEIRNYDRTIPINYRQPDEVWPTSTGDDNALMISPVPVQTLTLTEKSRKVSRRRERREGERKRESDEVHRFRP